MSDPVSFQVADLHDSGNELRVQWRRAPGAHACQADAVTIERIGQQVTTLTEAVRHASLARNIVSSNLLASSRPELTAAHRALGETLYELLDGPDRALARRLDDARRDGTTMHLVMRLRAADRNVLARHRALSWHLPLIASPDGPLALAPDVTIAVQIGDADLAARDTVPGGRLQVLFMASSPRDVQPVLDYEATHELAARWADHQASCFRCNGRQSSRGVPLTRRGAFRCASPKHSKWLISMTAATSCACSGVARRVRKRGRSMPRRSSASANR